MLVSGPGIAAGSTVHTVGSHADLAPTWLEIAGLPSAAEMDGKSLLPWLVTRNNKISTVASREPSMAYIEYHGLGNVPPNFVSAAVTPNIRLMDCFNNTFRALRFVDDPQYGNLLYAEFGSNFLFTGPLAFVEVFNMTIDPWNTINIREQLSEKHHTALHQMLEKLWHCKGAACRQSFTM